MRALQTIHVIHKALQIPIRVCNVVKSSSGSTGLTNACPDCNASLTKQDLCATCNKVVAYNQIKKKYVLDENDQRILSEKELTDLKNIDNNIKIEGTVSAEQFSESKIVGAYYLLPSTKLKKKSEQNQVEQNKKHYARLRQAVIDCPDLIAVKFSIRQKEKLGILKVEGKTIVLLTIAFDEYVQENDELKDLDISLTDNEKLDSKKLLKSIGKTDLTKIKDTYKEKLEAILSGNPEPEVKEEKQDEMWGSL